MTGAIVAFDFDPIFHKKLESGRKTASFSTEDKQAHVKDVFSLNMKSYMITSVLYDKSLWDYVSNYWYDAGFSTPNDAVEWFKKNFFKEDVGEQYGPAFKNVKGTIYTFRRISLDDLKDRLNFNYNEFSIYLWHLKYYLEMLGYTDPKSTGYDKAYLENCQEALNEFDEDPFLDFMEKLFPKNYKEVSA